MHNENKSYVTYLALKAVLKRPKRLKKIPQTFSREVNIPRMIFLLLKGLGVGVGLFGGLIGYLR